MTIYAQYQNSTKLSNLVTGITDLYRNYNNILSMRSNFLNINTASAQGLDNWGRILGVTRNQPYNVYPQRIFGFAYSGTTPLRGAYNFNRGNFYRATQSNNDLTDAQYRTLLILTYLKLNSNNSLSDFNNILKTYFKISKTVQLTNVNQIILTLDAQEGLLSPSEYMVTSNSPLSLSSGNIITLGAYTSNIQNDTYYITDVTQAPILIEQTAGVYTYIIKLNYDIVNVFPVPIGKLAYCTVNVDDFFVNNGQYNASGVLDKTVNMAVAYRIPQNEIQPYERYIFDPVNNLDILPRPAGVSLTVNFSRVTL